MEKLSLEVKEFLFNLLKINGITYDSLVDNYLTAQENFKRNDKLRLLRKAHITSKIGKSGRSVTGVYAVGAGTRRRVFAEDSYECVYCSVKVSARPDDAGIKNTLDHVIPGVRKKENLVTACLSCNAEKSNRTPEQAQMIPKYGRFRIKAYDLAYYQTLLKPANKN